MDISTIRKNQSFAAPRYQAADKTERPAQAGQTARAARATGLAVSNTLQQLVERMSQAGAHAEESRQTLQMGEGVLAEVQDSLERMVDLAQRAAGGGEMDRAALQAELERLGADIGRMLDSAAAGGKPLFLDENAAPAGELEAMLRTLLGEKAAGPDGVQALPQWLTQSIAQTVLSPEKLLAGLGLDETASGAEVLAALMDSPLDGGTAAGHLAALYLGAVIAGEDMSGAFDPQKAAEGLRQLLAMVAQGVSPDKAIQELTNGEFTGLADFESQFTGGTAPGLQEFLVNFLLANSGVMPLESSALLDLLAGLEGMNVELILGLLSAVQGTELPQLGAAGSPAGTPGTAAAAQPMTFLQAGELQIFGQDLSGVSVQDKEILVSGTKNVLILGTEQGEYSLRLTGQGTVTLQNGSFAALTVEGPAARLAYAGQTTLKEIHLPKGAVLTLEGKGLLQLGRLQAGSGSALRLAGGAVEVADKEGKAMGTLMAPVVIEGAASLAAAVGSVHSPDGKPLTLFDVVWKALLPGWSSLTAMTVNGQQAKMGLPGGENPTPLRLWLDKGDPNHGYPIHTLFLQGKDETGQPKTRYAYLRWSQSAGTFREISMYPNPFTVTGGEEERDWRYDESAHTLHILTDQVTAVSGGAGTDAEQLPFSGRIALPDHLGAIKLTLGGVSCRAAFGRAFSLGRENQVTLVLRRGTSNRFEGGKGCAGISLGDGTSLSIDCPVVPGSGETPVGTLTAIGSDGGAGIGRDRGTSRDRISHIVIRGGSITAKGTGGGAGIGAGKYGFMGPITILGGTLKCTGGAGGGAGIGGALGAPVGDISIRGGTVVAEAAYHAAAIGAGIQGECGDILITGTARIAKAVGGDPGADIGACLFGASGKVTVSGGADIGSAKPWTQAGISLPVGEGAVTLPQFRLSARALQLSRLNITTQELAQEAQEALEADHRWVGQIQTAYRALYDRMEMSFDSLSSMYRYIHAMEGLVRDEGTASTLLSDMKHALPLAPEQALQTHSKQGTGDVRHLLR